MIDERVTLEIRRLLTHTEMPITQVGSSLGFADASSFSKFVHRQFGLSPSAVRDEALSPVD